MNRFAVFITVVLGIWTLMHLYVVWRIWAVPWVSGPVARRVLVCLALLLGASYPLARMLAARNWDTLAELLGRTGATWIGVLFLLFSALLATDVLTAGGWFFPQTAPRIRGLAVIAAIGLSTLALVQASRPPVVRDYEVTLRGLPSDRDGLVVVQISDLHLGTLSGLSRPEGLVRRVNEMQPALVAIVGDLLDEDPARLQRMLPALRELKAPLGVWAVTGNHEYYAGLEASVRFFQKAGFNVLRDAHAAVVPGLVIAGVDDLTARGQFGQAPEPIERALANRPAGATILLSHTPWGAEVAAAAGADLMLSGHTHNGQIWPFNYLVRLRYPLIAGRYSVGGMPLIVCRGTGTWGPPMRLWYRSEIVRIRLRAGN